MPACAISGRRARPCWDEIGQVVGVEHVGDDDAVGGNDLGEAGGEDGRAGADELVTEDDLLLAIEALGLDEIELGRGGEGGDAGELDRGEGALDDLIGVVLA